jgi:hypothetical protein
MRSINLNNTELDRFINTLAAQRGESFDVVAEKLLEKAMKDMQYRSRRNAQKWQETKALKETVAALEETVIHLQTLQQIGAGREEEIVETE